MKIVNSRDFKERKRRCLFENEKIVRKVERIIKDIKKYGDKALFIYTKKFDGIKINKDCVEVSKNEIKEAYTKFNNKQIKAIQQAAKNIQNFCKRQLPKGWFVSIDGNKIGELIIPIERVGCYVPAGKYPLPSSALMSIIPAKIAGVEEIIVCTPPKKKVDEVIANEVVVVATDIAGADRIFKVGGTQAIAAMAFGTETIPKVDKIIGPGSAYVTLAKKLVYGYVDIDFLAGPSEVLIIGDESANPEWIAADLIAQGEHDENAYAVLVTPSEKIAKKVSEEVPKQLKDLRTKKTAEKSIRDKGLIILTKGLEECFNVANEFAPEHLELMIKNPEKYLDKVRNAGSIFLGNYSPEALGDYASGTNHVLPTNGLARVRGGLSVRDFLKFMSYQKISKRGMRKLKNIVINLARLEGLEAHIKSIEIRGE